MLLSVIIKLGLFNLQGPFKWIQRWMELEEKIEPIIEISAWQRSTKQEHTVLVLVGNMSQRVC